MNLMRALGSIIRLALLAAIVLIVGWAFYDFGSRYYERWVARQERPVELTVMHWGSPAEDRIVSDLVATFMKENPKVRITRINTGGGFRDKIKTMMAANAPPDVFYLPPDILPELARQQLIMPLDSFVQNEPKEWKDDFFPVVLDAFRFNRDNGAIGQGPLYALPKDFTTAVFYINVDLFEKAGIDWKKIQKQGWTWNEFEAEMKKIRALNGTPGYQGREIYGSLLQLWSDTIRNMLWTYDGDFFRKKPDGTADFANLGLGDAGSQNALELIARMRLVDKTSFNATGIAKDGSNEFTNGNIGCTGPIGRWETPKYKGITGFRWDVVPVPKGTVNASQIFYTGWAMSSRSRHSAEAYQLIRFLCGKEGQVQQARDGLAIPSLRSVAYSDDFLKPAGTGIPPHNSQAFLDAIPYARLAQLPREAEFNRMMEQAVSRAIQTGQDTPKVAAEKLQAEWTAERNSPLRQKQWPRMPWVTILSIAAGVVLTAGLLLWWKARREKLGALDRATERAGFLFIAPWIIGFLVLTLGPMIASLLLAFSRWSGLVPLSEAEFVGTANFSQLITYDKTFIQSLKVTAYFVLLGVPVSQVAALAIAMLMNSRVKGITIFRTIYFVPSVVSGAALAVLWLQLFNNDYGLINNLLRPILREIGWNALALGAAVLAIGLIVLRGIIRRSDQGEHVTPTASLLPGFALGVGLTLLVVAGVMILRGIAGPNPPNWFGVDVTTTPPVNDAMRWAIPGFVIMGLWGVGGGMIIYLAGLKGIPVSLYEAARIDGAGPARQFWNVTLPMLSPLIFYNLVMAIIGSFQVFTQAYIMTGPGPDNATLFYVLQLYRQAFEFHNMGYASAIAWVLFLIVLVLTMIVFRGSRKLVYYEGLRS